MDKRLLIITPDYSLNGANIVLCEMVDLLIELGYIISVIGSEDGIIRDRLEKVGANCIIREKVIGNNDVLFNHDMVILNTSSVHYYAVFYQNEDIPVYWWFHESIEQLSMQKANFVHLALLSSNFHFLAVTPKVINGLSQLYGVNAELLPMAIADVAMEGELNNQKDEVVRFFIPAAYTGIKGQDILLKAISMIPKELQDKCSFTFAGYKLSGQSEYYEKIKSIANELINVTFLDEISREEVYKFYRESDCVIAPSRVDSTPTTIVEAMMLRRLCIVSSGAGISEFMQDCVNGFVYEANDITELLKRILLVICERDSLQRVSDAGRSTYEDIFSTSAIKARLVKILHL